MPLITISSIDDPRVRAYSKLTESQLRNKADKENGIFIAESPKVISVALDKGYQALSLLCEEKHTRGDAVDIIRRCGDVPVYTGERSVLAQLTGYVLTRGVLCAMRRPAEKSIAEVCCDAKRIAVVHGVVEATNIGSIFRAASALGIDGIVLSTDSCDPLNRRAIRVSMGSVFLIPWVWSDSPISSLKAMGFTTVALALTDDSISIDDEQLERADRLAIVMGTEGDGLPQTAIAEADLVARIPMYHGTDSLNVASAAAVAFWQLRRREH